MNVYQYKNETNVEMPLMASRVVTPVIAKNKKKVPFLNNITVLSEWQFLKYSDKPTKKQVKFKVTLIDRFVILMLSLNFILTMCLDSV